jgi:hypothetical protein
MADTPLWRDLREPIQTTDMGTITLTTTQKDAVGAGRRKPDGQLPGELLDGEEDRQAHRRSEVDLRHGRQHRLRHGLRRGRCRRGQRRIGDARGIASVGPFLVFAEGYATCVSVGTAATLSMWGMVFFPIDLMLSTVGHEHGLPERWHDRRLDVRFNGRHERPLLPGAAQRGHGYRGAGRREDGSAELCMTVSALQNWKGATTASSVASLTDVYTSIPTSGNVAMVFATRELGSGTLSISDDFGDGVGWTLIKGPIAAAAASPIIIYGWYKVVGTCTAKTVTITNSTNTSLAIYVAEYKSDVAGTWALNGTATSASGTSTTPDPTGVVCDATASVVVGYQSNDGGTATAVVNWTRQANDLVVSANSVEDRFVASAATYDPSWTGAPAATNWAAIGAALKSTPAAAAAADGRDASVAARPGGSMGPRMRRALVQRFPDSPVTPVELTQSPAAPFRPGRGPGKGPMLLRRNIVWPSAIFTPDVTLALTGVQAAGSVGTLGVQHDQALTGSEATASVGSLTPGTMRGRIKEIDDLLELPERLQQEAVVCSRSRRKRPTTRKGWPCCSDYRTPQGVFLCPAHEDRMTTELKPGTPEYDEAYEKEMATAGGRSEGAKEGRQGPRRIPPRPRTSRKASQGR